MKIGDKILVRKKGILRKHSPDGITNHGPLSQFIRMEQSGLNAETSLKVLSTTNKTIFLTTIKV
jgi:hypothetical protein